MAPVNDGTGDNFPILPEDYEGLTTALRIKISADLKAIGNEQYKGDFYSLINRFIYLKFSTRDFSKEFRARH